MKLKFWLHEIEWGASNNALTNLPTDVEVEVSETECNEMWDDEEDDGWEAMFNEELKNMFGVEAESFGWEQVD